MILDSIATHAVVVVFCVFVFLCFCSSLRSLSPPFSPFRPVSFFLRFLFSRFSFRFTCLALHFHTFTLIDEAFAKLLQFGVIIRQVAIYLVRRRGVWVLGFVF